MLEGHTTTWNNDLIPSYPQGIILNYILYCVLCTVQTFECKHILWSSKYLLEHTKTSTSRIRDHLAPLLYHHETWNFGYSNLLYMHLDVSNLPCNDKEPVLNTHIDPCRAPYQLCFASHTFPLRWFHVVTIDQDSWATKFDLKFIWE